MMDVYKTQNEDTKRGQDHCSAVFIFNFDFERDFPAGIYLFKAKNRNTGLVYKICSKLTIRHQRGDVVLVSP